MGLSTAGVVDYKSGNLRYNAYTPQWGRDVPLASKLYRLYGSNVVVVCRKCRQSDRPLCAAG